jgi:hypothetical protein
MADYPDMRALARLSKVSYAHLESLEQINRRDMEYPGSGTPEWWALRLRYEELLARSIRKLWGKDLAKRGVDPLRATAAKWTELGNEDAQRNYERDGKTLEWWLENWGGGRESLKSIRQDFGR